MRGRDGMRLGQEEARRSFAAGRVARLATADEAGRPHLVPVTFAAADDVVVTAVDAKPKRTQNLRRLRNIRANPEVTLLVDHYAEDWDALWWVRADGTARVVEDERERRGALRLLADKYPQYRDKPPDGPVVRVTVTRWAGWAASVVRTRGVAR